MKKLLITLFILGCLTARAAPPLAPAAPVAPPFKIQYSAARGPNIKEYTGAMKKIEKAISKIVRAGFVSQITVVKIQVNPTIVLDYANGEDAKVTVDEQNSELKMSCDVDEKSLEGALLRFFSMPSASFPQITYLPKSVGLDVALLEMAKVERVLKSFQAAGLAVMLPKPYAIYLRRGYDGAEATALLDSLGLPAGLTDEQLERVFIGYVRN